MTAIFLNFSIVVATVLIGNRVSRQVIADMTTRVKVRSPQDGEYSSFHRYVRKGLVEVNWGKGEEIHFVEEMGNE